MNRNKIANRIRSLRKKQGLSVVEFCELINIKPTSISNIERVATFSTYKAFEISEVLNVSMDYLLCQEIGRRVEGVDIGNFIKMEVYKTKSNEFLKLLNDNGCNIDYVNLYDLRCGRIKNLEKFVSFCKAVNVSCDSFKN